MGRFNTGDLVRFRQWDDMASQYSVGDSGAILCRCSFTERMRKLCGKEFMITSIDNNGLLNGHCTGYAVSEDMLELVDSGITVEETEEMEQYLRSIKVRE